MTVHPTAAVNAMLYGLIYTNELDDQTVDRIVRQILDRPYFDSTPSDIFVALKSALQSDEQLTSLQNEHSEQEVRDFTRRVLERMESVYPWPEQPYRRLEMARWKDFAEARPIGRIGLDNKTVGDRLRRGFRSVDDGDHKKAVLMLRLQGGQELALTGPWLGDNDETTILSRDDRPAGDLIAAFRDATGFTEDEITVLPTET